MHFSHSPGGTFENRLQSGGKETGGVIVDGNGKISSTFPAYVSGFGAIGPGFDFFNMGFANSAAIAEGVCQMHELNYGKKQQKPYSKSKNKNDDNETQNTKLSWTKGDPEALIDSNIIKETVTSPLQAYENKQKTSSTKTPSPDLTNDGTNTSLHLAAASNNAKSVESILAQYSNDKNFICARNSGNETALMIAIKHEYFIIIEILIKHYKKFENLLSDDEKQMIFDLAVKTDDINFIQYLYSGALSKFEEEKHDILKKSIRNKFQKAVLHFMNSDQWQDIFRRHPSDTHSPIQLLLYYMPETAKELFDKCVKEKQQEYLSELLNDYPTNSITIKPLIDILQSLNTEIRRKYQKLFGCARSSITCHEKFE